jgi:hypothetical protein
VGAEHGEDRIYEVCHIAFDLFLRSPDDDDGRRFVIKNVDGFAMKRWNYLMSGNDEARVTGTSQYCGWIGVGAAGGARRHQDNAIAN